MCVSPQYVYADVGPGFERIETACGWCWSCQKNRLNDLVGRCLCEAAMCDWSRVLTLTYDDRKVRTPAQTKVIHKEDFQEFMKRLRRRFKTRYLVAGEYGEKKGRVHFHACLFGYGTPPSWDLNKRTQLDPSDRLPYGLWPWGHAFVDDAVSESSIRYSAKYLLKGARRYKKGDDNRYNKEWVSYSRIPIMGLPYVLELADRYCDERIFPSSFKYRPPFCSDNREYQFIGEARHVFLERIFARWPQGFDRPKNEVMDAASRRFFKERARRQWEAMPWQERNKILDGELRPVASSTERPSKSLFGAIFSRMVLETGYGSFAQLKEHDPEGYRRYAEFFRHDAAAVAASSGHHY